MRIHLPLYFALSFIGFTIQSQDLNMRLSNFSQSLDDLTTSLASAKTEIPPSFSTQQPTTAGKPTLTNPIPVFTTQDWQDNISKRNYADLLMTYIEDHVKNNFKYKFYNKDDIDNIPESNTAVLFYWLPEEPNHEHNKQKLKSFLQDYIDQFDHIVLICRHNDIKTHKLDTELTQEIKDDYGIQLFYIQEAKTTGNYDLNNEETKKSLQQIISFFKPIQIEAQPQPTKQLEKTTEQPTIKQPEVKKTSTGAPYVAVFSDYNIDHPFVKLLIHEISQKVSGIHLTQNADVASPQSADAVVIEFLSLRIAEPEYKEFYRKQLAKHAQYKKRILILSPNVGHKEGAKTFTPDEEAELRNNNIYIFYIARDTENKIDNTYYQSSQALANLINLLKT